MSVILFSRTDLYQNLANAYEGLKHLQRPYFEVNDDLFYKSLRRLYFANVATFLCQYHDDSPLEKDELTGIDPFQELQGKDDPFKSNAQNLHDFLSEWDSLKYNTVTNDGEIYSAREAQKYIEKLIRIWIRKVVEQAASRDKRN